MAEEGHRRSDAHHDFAHKGEYGEKSHRLIVEMQHVDLIMLEHRVKKGGEGRNQASLVGLYEDWDLSGCPGNASARRGPSHRLSPLVETGSKHGAHLVHVLIVEHQGSAERRLEGWRRTWRRQGLLPLVCSLRRHSDEAGRAHIRLEGRSRVSRKQRDWGSEAWAMDNNCVGCGLRVARWILRQHGEAETPTSNQPPRIDQGRRLLGPTALRA